MLCLLTSLTVAAGCFLCPVCVITSPGHSRVGTCHLCRKPHFIHKFQGASSNQVLPGGRKLFCSLPVSCLYFSIASEPGGVHPLFIVIKCCMTLRQILRGSHPLCLLLTRHLSLSRWLCQSWLGLLMCLEVGEVLAHLEWPWLSLCGFHPLETSSGRFSGS